MAPVRERVAAVLAEGRQGSGYLLAPRVVLTAAHVVRGAARIRAAVPDGPGEVGCRVLWQGDPAHDDAALLLAADDLTAGPLPPVDWGTHAGLEPLTGCQAVGFPHARRGPGGVLESEQLLGTVKPGSSLIGGLLVLDSAYTPPAARPDGGSPWAGFSGAALFHGDVLLGVVRADPHGWAHGRVEAVPAALVLGRDEPRAALAGVGLAPPPPVGVGGTAGADTAFERDLGRYLVRQHGTLSIFGLDLRDRSAVNWPLEASYVSLTATAPQPPVPDDDALPRASLPADQALAGHHRVLLRGAAGSGKTTLVQWLAVCAAHGRLPDGLGHPAGRVPFVLPLRTLVRSGPLPAGPDGFLVAAGNPLAGAQPPGWAVRVLAAGRALVLVDGMDEVGGRQRDLVQDWLAALLPLHPDNRWLVTSRPSAVHDGWLAHEGFAELTLSPMSGDDTTAFVTRWHRAARAGAGPREAERLDGYRDTLLTALRTTADLARLATNPLMCGMICALHRDRGGYLPQARKELYDAALDALVAGRDRRRRLGPLDGVELTAPAQIQLLQRLAYWLIRNGRSELDHDQARRLVAEALPAVPAAAAQGDASAVLRHLLLRSGLLRERPHGAVDFVHRTFQDYLAARRAVEEWDIGLLVDKAPDPQWEDVVRMAVAHAGPRERALLLRGLLGRADATDAERARVSLLAMASLEHAVELDPAVRREVTERAYEFVPPRDLAQARTLAGIGSMVLELLPGPRECPDEQAALATVVTASMVGTDAALSLLGRYRRHPSLAVRSQLAWTWHRFDDQRYFDEVVSHLPPADLVHVAWSTRHLRLLHDADRCAALDLRGDFTAGQLAAHLDPDRLTALSLVGNRSLTDLEVLRGFGRLRTLGLRRCDALRDLSALSALPLRGLLVSTTPGSVLPGRPLDVLPGSLAVLHLRHTGNLAAPPAGRAAHVRLLTLDDLPATARLEWLADALPGLREVRLGYPDGTGPVPLGVLGGLPALRSVTVRGAAPDGHEGLTGSGVQVRRLDAGQGWEAR